MTAQTPAEPVDSELIKRIEERALFARLETVRLISIAKTGHYASAFSAAEIFATATRPLDPAGRGWTLHQLSTAAQPSLSAARL